MGATGQTTANQHSEVHIVCAFCHPHNDRAVCGAVLRGVLHRDRPGVTCVVCASLMEANIRCATPYCTECSA